MKTVHVDKDVWKQLNRLKIEEDASRYNDIIKKALEALQEKQAKKDS